MVLLSFLLVLAAAVTLVIGLLNSGLGLIYVSIACSLGAGVVLALAVLRARPQPVVATAGGPAPEPMRAPERASAGGMARSGVAVLEREEPTTAVDALEDESFDDDEAESDDEGDGGEWGVDDEWGGEGELIFPIADYDELTASEISPLLPELDPDELELVRERELEGRSRAAILNRIDQLLGELAPPKRAPAKKATAAKKTAAKKTAAKKTAAKKAAAKKAAPAQKTAAKKAAPAKKADAKKAAPAKAAGKTAKKR